ncbi:hypothetical protein EV127DRAFT_479364 [Xylaria flabelliformis]|nr:hypothetical protein EV127DRAFT_479364 [Xylaria flabelliformis]
MSEPQVVKVNTDSPLGSFPQFTRLPPELRLMIWVMAMEESWIIRILRDNYQRKTRTLRVGEDTFYDVPKFFFVNQECRTVAMKVYTDSSLGIYDSESHLRVYIDMKVKRGDKLEFGCGGTCPKESLEYVEQVEPGMKVMKPGDDVRIHQPCCSNKALHDWLLTLLSMDCISKTGFQLCRYYETIRDIIIDLEHPFLLLQHSIPKRNPRSHSYPVTELYSDDTE